MQDKDQAAPAGFGMTDLEESLAGPDGKTVAAAIEARLSELFDAYSHKLNSGLHPDDFRRTEAILGALAGARDIVIAFPKG